MEEGGLGGDVRGARQLGGGVQLPGGRVLHSSAFQLNLIRVGHTSPCPPV